MTFQPGNAQHIGDRGDQQDAFGFSDPSDSNVLDHAGFLGIVADGMGGMDSGSEASNAAVRTFLAAYRTKPSNETIPQALDRAVRQANRAVADLGANAGTTLVAAVVRGRDLYWISVGDSRIYLAKPGRMAQLNAEHNFASLLKMEVAEGRLTMAEVDAHPEKEHLTAYVGGPQITAVDRNLRPLPVDPGDVIALCSDGVYRALGDGELLGFLRSGTPAVACERIVAAVLAKRRPHQDNATIIAWECVPSLPPGNGSPASQPSQPGRSLFGRRRQGTRK